METRLRSLVAVADEAAEVHSLLRVIHVAQEAHDVRSAEKADVIRLGRSRFAISNVSYAMPPIADYRRSLLAIFAHVRTT
jgi:hypothetical protein